MSFFYYGLLLLRRLYTKVDIPTRFSPYRIPDFVTTPQTAPQPSHTRPNTMRFSTFHNSIPALLASLTLFQPTSATYGGDYGYPAIPTVSPIYLTASLSSTTETAFYPYPTSSAAHNCSCQHHTELDSHSHYEAPATYISVVYGTPSGYRSVSESGNATYQGPVLSTGVSTTAVETSSSAAVEGSVSSSSEPSTASGTTQDTTTTSQSPSPTQSEPAEPQFTGKALRLPELQVWKWNIIVSVGLGLMVMWI